MRALVRLVTLAMTSMAFAIMWYAWSPAAAQTPSEVLTIVGTLRAGQAGEMPYEALKPAKWNGTLLLDLDFVGARANLRTWYLDHGYAIGGVRRRLDEGGYQMREAADNLIEVRRLFIERVGMAPRWTIVTGTSRGAYVALSAIDMYPEVFNAALAKSGGSLGLIAKMLSALDMVWSLKTLEDPHGPLKVVQLTAPPARTMPPTPYADQVALEALVKTARMTPRGRARLALAASFAQAPRWGIRNSVRPAAGDLEGELKNVVESAVTGAPMYTQSIRWTVEQAAGGNPSWNHDVDYADLLTRSGLRDLVEYAYRQAGADLNADLATLARAPRIAADPKAVANAERLLTYQGKIKGPVITANTMDPSEPPSIETAYAQTLRRAGTGDLLRIAYVGRTGHANYTLLETVTLVQALVNRLDTGQWGDTMSAVNLNALAATLKSSVPSDADAQSAFVDMTPAPALRTWDFTNWGSYRLPPGRSSAR